MRPDVYYLRSFVGSPLRGGVWRAFARWRGGLRRRGGATAMARRPHVALLVETSSVFGRRILEGIARYLRGHRGWSVFLEQRALDTGPPRWLESWRGDGIISRVSSPGFAAAVLKAGVAAVDLTHREAPF